MENIPDRSWMYRERRPGVKGLTSRFINGVRCFEDRRDNYMLAHRRAHSRRMGPPTPDMGPSAWRPPLGDSQDPLREPPPTYQLSSKSGSTGLTILETMCMGSGIFHDQDKGRMGVKRERLLKGFVRRCSRKEQEATVD
ncbi:hypothetical protein M9H77_27437 [Catharanthus roseus]|uniref:Uncharacterized protein n=1 Tax=Catharanthus roseus TaxID=4058 RepID=A0ACC0ACW4_CATRO|nr:hypothetical protein M9H77_27437 [Catharanthus roseus]